MSRHLPRLLAALLLCLLSTVAAFAADSLSGTISDDTGSLTVSAGAKYIMPQHYKGSGGIYDNAINHLKKGDTNYSTPDSILAPSISLAAERKTSLELPGLNDIRLKGEFSYAGGSGRSSGVVAPGAGNLILALSVDPAYNWVGGISPAGGMASSRVSIFEDNFDLWLGLEGKGLSWQSGAGGVTATPVFGAGIYAATQLYKVSTKVAALSSKDTISEVERIRTTDIGPELRAGITIALPGGASVSAMANAAALVGWADLDASQQVRTSILWSLNGRSPSFSASRSLNDVFVSGLFGLSLRGDVPVSEKCSLGLEASGRIWTSRPTIENPRSTGGDQTFFYGGTNTGVRISQDSASELGAALRFGYSF